MQENNINSYKSTLNKSIQHKGVVTKISDDKVTVSLNGDINCDGCNAKMFCGTAESNDKVVEILHPNPSIQLYDQVNVFMNKSAGMRAVFWAYLFPFIIMMVVLVVSSVFVKEWFAGVLSLLILLPYYLLLFALKKAFKKSFKFSILKTS